MGTGCLQCDISQGENALVSVVMCPKHEIEYLDACIERDMSRIEVLKQKLEQERKLQCPAQMISEPQNM